MALRVEQNVPIVSILDLQDVAEEGVTGSRLQEVVASLGIAFPGDACLELLRGAQLLDALGDLVGESHGLLVALLL